ncbi:MAG TPA: Clp protease N-terminal domain-containing protein [Candidatus Limnocylindria bacterium]|nr:Clp protease N-terminal domain-containing protein [Candidatus Limnocylindria bacterium]
MEVEVVWEDERVLAFRHPFPESPVHAVVIPKAHVGSLLAPEALDPALLASMLRAVQSAATALGLDREGFQLRANAAAPGVTPHMHWHVRGPGLPPPEGPQPEGPRGAYVTAVGPGWTLTPYGKVHGSASVFDRFDESGRGVLKAALDEAMRFRHNYVGTEHLLLGVLRDDGMAPLLAGLPVDLDKARRSVEAAIGRGGSPTTPAEVHLTPRTTKVLELARAEADRLGRPRVGAREVLLGIVREGGGVASQVLAALGVDAAALKERIEKEPPPTA